jgi:hypothetical protein
MVILGTFEDRSLTQDDLTFGIPELQTCKRFKRQAVLDEADGNDVSDTHLRALGVVGG